MSGEVLDADAPADYLTSSRSVRLPPEGRPNHVAVASNYPEARRLTRRNPLLPGVPGLPTLRGKVATGVFVLLLLLSRSSFVIGAVVGGMQWGFLGAGIGVGSGWILGRWMRWSLGLRRRRLTHGFVVRMLERGNNDRPKLLESLVETLRGHRLSAMDCRYIAAAYGEATRRLQTCDSPRDRAAILMERDRKVLAASCGRHERQRLSPRAGRSTSRCETTAVGCRRKSPMHPRRG